MSGIERKVLREKNIEIYKMKSTHVFLFVLILTIFPYPVAAKSIYEIKAEQLTSTGETIKDETVIEIDEDVYHVFTIFSNAKIKYVILDNDTNIVSGEAAKKATLYLLIYDFVEKNSESIQEHTGNVDKAIIRLQAEDKRSLESKVEESTQRFGAEFKESVSSITGSIKERASIDFKLSMGSEVKIYADALGRKLSTKADDIIVRYGHPAIKVGVGLTQETWEVLREEKEYIKKAAFYESTVTGLAVIIEGEEFSKSEYEIVIFNSALYRLPKILKVLHEVTDDTQIKKILESESIYFENLHVDILNFYSSAEAHSYDGEEMKNAKIYQFESECANTNANLEELLKSTETAVLDGKDIDVWEYNKKIKSIKKEIRNQNIFYENGYYNDAIRGCKAISEDMAPSKEEAENQPILDSNFEVRV